MKSNWLRVAAAIAVVLGGSLFWKTSRRAESPIAAATTFETAVGQNDSIQLSDGTLVILAPGSRLEVGGGYGQGKRIVQLSGEALFEVRHDDRQPFSVHAGAATVRDIGTRFTVRAIMDAEVEVAVATGAVVLHATNRDVRQGVVLHAGDLGVLDRNGTVRMQSAALSDADTAFANGRLVFQNASLSEVAVELERWYGIKLRVDAPSLAARRVTATFQRDSADQVLNVLGLALGVRIERSGNTAIVRTRR